VRRGSRRLVECSSYALSVALIGLVVYGGFQYALGGLPFLVVGDNPSSMSPTINYGDLTVNYLEPFSSLGPGNVIAFHDPRGNPGIIIHRIVSETSCGTNTCFITKGDNNATNAVPDPWYVSQQDYSGRVILVIPYVGYVSPTLWGFRGGLILLPLSFVFLLVLFLSVERSTSKETKTGSGASPEARQ
jgi:signal peptidase I